MKLQEFQTLLIEQVLPKMTASLLACTSVTDCVAWKTRLQETVGHILLEGESQPQDSSTDSEFSMMIVKKVAEMRE
jgi:hypothetical protein